MEKIVHFSKFQGTGNDFIMLDNRQGDYTSLSEGQINSLCDRKYGIGADGLMLLNNKENYDFEMQYHNSEGKVASMCGNGGRCIVKFANILGIHKNIYKFIAADGEHMAEIDLSGLVRLKMLDVTKVEIHSNHFIIDTGSPHYVKYVTDILNFDILDAGRSIRNSEKYAAQGINVNFVEILDGDSIYVRTFERGVEDETLSCGTGVTAAAIVSAHNENGFNRVEIKTPGGHLSVEFEKKDEDHFENIWLAGPADFVFSGQIDLETLHTNDKVEMITPTHV